MADDDLAVNPQDTPANPPNDPPADPPSDAPADPPSDPPKDAPEGDWRDQMALGVPDDVRKKFRTSLDRAGSPADVARELHQLRKAVNDKVQPPADDAPDEEKDEFAKAMGWPGDAESYEYEPPEHLENISVPAEDLEGTQKEFFEFANEVRMPKAVAKATMDKFYRTLEETEARKAEFAEESGREVVEALKAEYGGDADANIQLGKSFLLDFTDSPEEAEAITSLRLEDGRMLGDVKPIIKALVHAGRQLKGEGELRGASMSDDQKSDLQGQIDEITTKAHADGTYTSPAVQNKLRPLYEKLHGTEPADGRPT